MTWVAWRQYRAELFIALGILVALSAFLIPTGLDKRDLFESLGLDACLSTSSENCLHLRNRFVMSYNSENSVVGWFNFAPGIIGLLLAAPLVLEMDHRTHRLAWTQSITRERWLFATMGMALLGVIVFSLLLTLLMTWWHSPLDKVQGDGGHLRQSFGFEGVLPLAYTLFALALAMAAGVLSRRLIVTIPVALVGFVFARITIEPRVRPGVQFGSTDGPAETVIGASDITRFWTYQAIEASIFLTLAVVLLGLTIWVVRRRT
jgi:hypothetical protein